MTQEQNEPTPQPSDNNAALAAELERIQAKMANDEELTVEEENTMLCTQLAVMQQEFAQCKTVMNEMVKHLCAVIFLFHKGTVKIDKAQLRNFFNQWNARVLIGTEDVTGNTVVTVETKPRKGKRLIVASDAEVKAVEKTRIIQ